MFRPISSEVLSDNWGILTKYEFELRRRNGEWQRQTRETYDRGNGATCLLFNPETICVLLTRQFRLPVFLNGGIEALIEAPAGLLEGSDADGRMRAELLEETGFQTSTLTHLFDVYMSPGSVTEYLSFFKGVYSASDKVANGGGKSDEGEDIEVLEVPLSEAMKMIESGDIRDAKTIILLQHLMIEILQKKS
ncbi:nudix-type nucleoside diphosphatase, YffH/AdpP family [Ruegeria halocynthiae]|uniref:GDP-mannose pyrophosphatase n=1 Tax=Ruegeria halocynthiae TaxID=985054 RepID=A0A1H3FSQ9_9RHOB|nr:NUDIX domain-containing protein [Ruegeria halocynthiae]SDX93184.1 nudix-type nucleoside diphosphatase, YffH/AdpP family [Ruegeria halocynthiae]